MTNAEQKTIDQLYQTVNGLRTENQKFREDVTNQVEALGKKTDSKHMPIFLEQDILKVAQNSIAAALKQTLEGYNSPLTKLIASVVDENSVALRSIISDSFTEVIKTQDFKNSIVTAFSHKVAKTIISNNDGLFDKVSNELKQDAIFKSKMQLAVSNVVEECINRK